MNILPTAPIQIRYIAVAFVQTVPGNRRLQSHDPLASTRACGAMDNAPDYGSGDSRFDSWQARTREACSRVSTIYKFHACTLVCLFFPLPNETQL